MDALVAAAFGPGARVTGRTPIEPWAVMHCTLAGAGSPDAAIAKWLREDPNNFRVDPRQIATEQAALEFMAELGFGGAPRLYAADRASNLLLIEDLSPRRTLVELINAQGPDAVADGFLAFARLCGALGAATAGQERRFLARRRAYGDIDPLVGRKRGFGPLWPEGRTQLAAAGLEVPVAVEAEMQAVLELLADPGPFLALTNGDAHVNNVMVEGADARLIDFEAAAFRHALVAAAWIHMPGSFWITVAGPIAQALEDAVRAALVAGVPEAADDGLFGAGLAAACLWEAVERFSRFARLEARGPAESGRLQMVYTLDAAVAVARRHRAFPVLAGWCERASDWLRRRWPDADRDGVAPYTPRR